MAIYGLLVMPLVKLYKYFKVPGRMAKVKKLRMLASFAVAAVVIAGVLLMTPGYFTDTVGFLLLVPPIRSAIYEWLKTRITVVEPGVPPSSRTDRPGVIDLDDDEWR